jgi:hypothetical protein
MMSRIGCMLSRIRQKEKHNQLHDKQVGCWRSRMGTGRAERHLVEQYTLYGEHELVRLKKDQDQLQEEQEQLLHSEGARMLS